ncbi:dihydrofolate reductase [Vaginisenegalia massiliensis]|uniref:dihydrofolate reductase n=1 Tax=Vaginisenegalia massiliensis TaxID=2058294 RepID=UPI000F52318C|nr:dihydrofolate reductase [Vaginisenegalia massiliensis]
MMYFVYAQDRQGGIGYQNDLPWHLPNDLKFFKEVTMGKTIVMGRKTFESMGKRLLPGRHTIVVTHQADYGKEIEGLEVVQDIDYLRKLSKTIDLMVIGGAGLFNHLWSDVDQIIRTYIDADFTCDVFMPSLDLSVWQCDKVVKVPVSEANPIPHQFEWWSKIKQSEKEQN